PAGAEPTHGGAHRAGHRPPAAHRHGRGPDRGPGPRPGGRDRHPRRAARARRPLPGAVGRERFGGWCGGSRVPRGGARRVREPHRRRVGGGGAMLRTLLPLLPDGSRRAVVGHLLLTVLSLALRAAGVVLLVPLVAA